MLATLALPVLAAALVATLAPPPLAAKNPETAPDAVPNRLLVGFRADTSAAERDAVHARVGGALVRRLPALAVDVVQLTPAAGAALDTSAVVDAAARYAAAPSVRYVERDHRMTILPPPSGAAVGPLHRRDLAAPIGPLRLQLTPNDPLFSQQWHHATIGSAAAWDRSRATQITIAIVDTGVDCDHEDLKAACIAGYDFINRDDDPHDDQGHGTIEAGVAAAVVDNRLGVAGVGRGARIMPLKVLDERGQGSHATIAEALVWATDRGAAVVNMSLGGLTTSSTLSNAIAYAARRDVVLVAASGNAGDARPTYPAAYPSVIGVGATGPDDRRASFSSHGSYLDLVAPGVNLLTTTAGGGYQAFSGTSEACAVVSGAAALLRAQRPERDATTTLQLMLDTAVDLGAPGWDPYYGWGRLDAGTALAADAPPAEPDDPADGCERTWELVLRGWPDLVGPAGLDCPGCDGIFSDGDRMAATGCPLEPLEVTVSAVDDPAQVYWRGSVARAPGPALAAEARVQLCAPPPYRVTLETTETDCYTLCPNAPASVVVTQDDFDRARGARPGTGRTMEHGWRFWRCRSAVE